MRKNQVIKIIFPLVGLMTLHPIISSAQSMLLGIFLAVFLGNPYIDFAKKYTHRLLAISVVGLGAGMNISVIGKVGLDGFGYTVAGITLALVVGFCLGKYLKLEGNTSVLITVGTAICGGSAIAAVAPVIRARHHEVSVSLGVIFLLNASALIIFPFVGHQLGLDQSQFGLWSALAIHDTSSVVGATLAYGRDAMEIGTTVKLARALWIIPIAAIIGIVKTRKVNEVATKQRGKRPWFILGFLLMAALVTWVPELRTAGYRLEALAKRLMVLTLFLIGSGLTKETIAKVGAKPFIQGTILWIIISGISLFAIDRGWIS